MPLSCRIVSNCKIVCRIVTRTAVLVTLTRQTRGWHIYKPAVKICHENPLGRPRICPPVVSASFFLGKVYRSCWLFRTQECKELKGRAQHFQPSAGLSSVEMYLTVNLAEDSSRSPGPFSSVEGSEPLFLYGALLTKEDSFLCSPHRMWGDLVTKWKLLIDSFSQAGASSRVTETSGFRFCRPRTDCHRCWAQEGSCILQHSLL